MSESAQYGFKPNGSYRAALPVGVYGTVAGSREPLCHNAVVDIDADAIGLHLPKAPIGAPALLIDGPEVAGQ